MVAGLQQPVHGEEPDGQNISVGCIAIIKPICPNE